MITGIILASGLSRRMAGADKLLLPLGGAPMVERVLQAAHASRLDDIILAYHNPAVGELAGRYRIRPVYNPHAAQGQSASIKAGVLAADPATQAYMFLTGDQPRLDAASIDLLIDAWLSHREHIIVPVYGGRRGSPTVFPAVLRESLLALEGDTGGRAVIGEHAGLVVTVDMPRPGAGRDVDTPDDYAAMVKQ